jgi:hypothetical protein
MDGRPIVFENWEPVLLAEVPPDCQSAWRTAIVKFRYWLRETGKAPVDAAFKEHLEWKKSYLSPEGFTVRRAALRWYYKEGRRRMQAAEAVLNPAKQQVVSKKPTGAGAGVLSARAVVSRLNSWIMMMCVNGFRI